MPTTNTMKDGQPIPNTELDSYYTLEDLVRQHGEAGPKLTELVNEIEQSAAKVRRPKG